MEGKWASSRHAWPTAARHLLLLWQLSLAGVAVIFPRVGCLSRTLSPPHPGQAWSVQAAACALVPGSEGLSASQGAVSSPQLPVPPR